MNVGDVLLSGILVMLTFNIMRQMERWLHRHIFKVGWLITKKFETTTILYYTFFLPGIIINQFVRWLAAGVMDVRAERSFSLPKKQEIGELNLNFIQISPKTSAIRLAFIKITPFVAGLLIILFIAENIFDIRAVGQTLSDGNPDSFFNALRQMTGATDFWLWAYLLFTVSNTMTPDFSLIRNYSRLLFWGFVGVVVLLAIGVGQAVVDDVLSGPVANILNLFSTAFIVIVVFDIIAVALLAAIENTIEYITGDSATFKNNKMVVMTREEIRAEREKARKKAITQREEQRKTSVSTGPPSVYKLMFDIPKTPGEEAITSLPSAVIADEPPEKGPSAERPVLAPPSVILGSATREIRFNMSRDASADDEDVQDESLDDSSDYHEDVVQDDDDIQNEKEVDDDTEEDDLEDDEDEMIYEDAEDVP